MYRAQFIVVLAVLIELVHSWDIAVTVGDRIEFYTNDGKKANTVHFNSQNLTALAYDEVQNMLLYVDKQNENDTICGYKISFNEYQCYIERNQCYIERNGRSIQGLAFDPVTQKLFFTDIKERSINWLSFKPGFKNNVYGNLLIKMDEGIPTDIAVDSCRGYVYWINTNLAPSTIERARFDGSDREVVIKATHEWDLQSLAIDQQAKKIYWKMPYAKFEDYINSADLNGKNREEIIDQWYCPVDHLNAFSLSNEFLLSVSSCTNDNPKKIYKNLKPFRTSNYVELIKFDFDGVIGIVTNYKIKDQFQGISECSQVLNNYNTDDSTKIAREYEGPFCVNGIKVSGQSLCKCTPGYTGVRCETSVCDNYCLQGNCSFTEDGLPECRCNAGYSGERCEVYVCSGYCLNNGTCSLNGDGEPVCLCKGEYLGSRCEGSVCDSYCWQGNCSFNEEGLPECRCNAGYSGERCEVNVCSGYCLNNGTCILNEEDEAVCECIGEYEGRRCELPNGVNNVDGSLIENIEPACQTQGSILKDDQNNAISSAFKHYTAERNITLADLLANWQKPVATISVVVEVKTNN